MAIFNKLIKFWVKSIKRKQKKTCLLTSYFSFFIKILENIHPWLFALLCSFFWYNDLHNNVLHLENQRGKEVKSYRLRHRYMPSGMLQSQWVSTTPDGVITKSHKTDSWITFSSSNSLLQWRTVDMSIVPLYTLAKQWAQSSCWQTVRIPYPCEDYVFLLEILFWSICILYSLRELI